MDVVVNLISSVGFPIAVSIYLIHYMNEEQKEMRETIAGLREAILKLIERIDKS